MKTPIEVELLQDRGVIWEGCPDLEEKSYGKKIEERLELSLVELLYLLEKGKISVRKGKKIMDFKSLMRHGVKLDKRLHEKYIVYRDLRDRGLVVKTGFKFGCDFRVYQRGVKVKKGPKSTVEHTKWIVFATSEDYTCSFAELSRAVRLAHSIRARMLWAVVDNENDVTYYEVLRMKP